MQRHFRLLCSSMALVCMFFAANVAAGNEYGEPHLYDQWKQYSAGLLTPYRPNDSLWDFGGWIEASVFLNQYGQKNAYDRGYLEKDSGNTTILQNARRIAGLNQAWGYVGKELDGSGFDLGGRVDFVLGTDAVFVQSENLEFNYRDAKDRWQSGDYYAALAQAYLEVGYNNFSLKAGKFLAPLGSASLMSPDRFFYTLPHSYAMTPNTLSGVIASADFYDILVFDELSIFGGWVSGEDRTFDSGADNAFTGGVRVRLWDSVTASYALVAGKDREWQPMGDVFNGLQYFVHSFILDLNLGRRWNYTFEWTLRDAHTTYEDGHNQIRKIGGWGINQELIFSLNEQLAFGARFEWMKVWGNGAENLLNGAAEQDQAYSFSLGANWQPTPYLSVRPEIRYDWLENARYFNRIENNLKDTRRDQWTFGASILLKF